MAEVIPSINAKTFAKVNVWNVVGFFVGIFPIVLPTFVAKFFSDYIGEVALAVCISLLLFTFYLIFRLWKEQSPIARSLLKGLIASFSFWVVILFFVFMYGVLGMLLSNVFYGQK